MRNITARSIGRWLDPTTGVPADADAIHALASSISGALARDGGIAASVAMCGLSTQLAPATLIGAWTAGCRIVPIRFDATPAMREDMLEQIGEGVLISEGLGRFEGARVTQHGSWRPFESWADTVDTPSTAKRWLPDEPAAVLFTSGSSGRPKGVVHSQCNIMRAAALFADHFELRKGETLACLAPVHTASGLRSLVMPLVRDVNVALWARGSGGLAETFESLARLNPQVLLCGPHFVATLAAAGKRLRSMLPSLRCIASTGAALGEKDRAGAMQALGVEVLDFYGLSETGGIVLAESAGSPRPGYLPPACAGVQTRLVPVAGRKDIFKLEIAGPNLFLGYLGQPAMRRTVFDTGDLVQQEAGGLLRLVGRSDNAVKSEGTEWIFPERLETWLRNQPLVRDAHVESCLDVANGRLELRARVDFEDGAHEPDFAQWRTRISSELGPEYCKLKLVRDRVERSALGKVERATSA